MSDPAGTTERRISLIISSGEKGRSIKYLHDNYEAIICRTQKIKEFMEWHENNQLLEERESFVLLPAFLPGIEDVTFRVWL